MKALFQAAIGPNNYLMIDIDEPDWAHEILRAKCLDKGSTYQVVEGPSTWIGYRFATEKDASTALMYVLAEEEKRMHTHALPSGGDNDYP